MANGYTLTRGMADAIVTAVQHDPGCRQILPTRSLFQAFGGIRHAGTVRNILNNAIGNLAALDGMALRLVGASDAARETEDYWDTVGSKEACTGVAAVTARALNKLVGTRGYEFLTEAGAVDRTPSDPARDFHTATSVTINGDKRYVFDWHATLDLANPYIFNSEAAFKAGGPCVRYAQFWGWG